MHLFLSRSVRLAFPLLVALLALAVVAYLGYFVAHVWLVFGYAYPLDYGEGPLLAQIAQLRAGVPIWQIYADPAAPPYLVVNYPPIYLLLVAALSWLSGSVLLAGRLLSLLATLGCMLALCFLVQLPGSAQRGWRAIASPAALVALIWLTIPIVREWAVLLRVDMLGVCFGLWGLFLLRRALFATRPTGRSVLQQPAAWGAGVLLLLTMFTKPSLIAAPAAAGLWLLFLYWQTLRHPDAQRYQQRRRILELGLSTFAVLLLGGGLLFGLLQWASGGWFALHAVAANANRWDLGLALHFWRDQAFLRWPLALAGLLGCAWCLRWQRAGLGNPLVSPSADCWLAAFYTLAGVVTAVGVGKVGAYSNYFLELYAGLLWLIAVAIRDSGQTTLKATTQLALRLVLCALLLASLLYYPPLWSETLLRQAGQVEPMPPRMAFGRYGLWRDVQREAAVLAAQARVQAALSTEVRAAGSPLFTDMPGVAAIAGVQGRLQVFEQRQLFDQGMWDQRALLIELVNGRLPLAVIDYLGNWLTPEMIAVLERRYAHDGSLGTFDLYRPIAPGPRTSVDLPFGVPDGAIPAIRISGYHLVPPTGGAAGLSYAPGELLALTLEWQRDAAAMQARTAGSAPLAGDLKVVLQLTDGAGRALLESERLLLYGALPPDDWPLDGVVQHMHPLALPSELPPRNYGLAVTLRVAGQDLLPPRQFAVISLGAAGGHHFPETNYFVPDPFLQEWEALGGIARVGYPLTPVVPFAWGSLQCFERTCLELRGDMVQQRALGERLYLAETVRGIDCLEGAGTTPGQAEPCAEFAPLWAGDAAASLGPPISGELLRQGYIVQWTRYARLERHAVTGDFGLGRLGDDSLRLPPGMRYRWP